MCLTGESTSKLYCLHNSLSCGFVRTLWNSVHSQSSKSAPSRLEFKAEVQKDDAVEDAGGTTLGCSRITFHTVPE